MLAIELIKAIVINILRRGGEQRKKGKYQGCYLPHRYKFTKKIVSHWKKYSVFFVNLLKFETTTTMLIKDLQPRQVWEQFEAITRVPRPSKKEEKIIEFLIDFAIKHNLEWQRDEIGNVVIRKGATPGYEQRETVILQSHMDMVCEKNSDVEFDFDTQPISAVVDGEWVRAEGTTLGADCGIGMAAAMALLLDEEAEHGPIEALFTVDEETGLTGAFNLGEGMLTGKYLLNLDSEDEGEIFIGCAGGVDTVATFNITLEAAPQNYTFYRFEIADLVGATRVTILIRDAPTQTR